MAFEFINLEGEFLFIYKFILGILIEIQVL